MSTDAEFRWDVLLSCASSNRDVVRDIADGVKVLQGSVAQRSDGDWHDKCHWCDDADSKSRPWRFDEWIIQPGDSIPAKTEDGLEHSRVLVLCLSVETLAADWPQLESHTFRFKDPLNHNRRFIPLRLDDTPHQTVTRGIQRRRR